MRYMFIITAVGMAIALGFGASYAGNVVDGSGNVVTSASGANVTGPATIIESDGPRDRSEASGGDSDHGRDHSYD